MAFFIFGPVGPNMEISPKAPRKGITSGLFLPKSNWSKMVSSSIRRLGELNLCGFFDFELMVLNIEIRPQFSQKEQDFNFVPTKVLLTIRHSQKSLI